MRRRWKALVAFGAVVLVSALFILLPPRDDGLDWIRSYGGRERREPDSIWFGSGQPIKDVTVVFYFESEPSKLLSKLKSLSADEFLFEDQDLGASLCGSLPNAASFTWWRQDRCLIVCRKLPPTLLDLAFAKLSRLFP
jgi:hypothetical protein